MSLTMTTTPTETELEFDRQVDALEQAGLPGLLDVKDECFRAMLEPLRDLLPPPAAHGGGIPFVVVVPDAPVAELLPAVHTPAGDGATLLSQAELTGFSALPELDVPAVPYLLLDVDTGQQPAGAAPAAGADDPATVIAAGGRSPLTLVEGLAMLLCDCGVRRSGPSFALLGTRDGAGRHPLLRGDGERLVLTAGAPGEDRVELAAAASCAGRRPA